MRRAVILLSLALGCSSSSESAPSNDAGAETAAKTCAFNRDCADAERCDCTTSGCLCAVGPRGKGKSGVDPCASALDCASGVCVDGPSGMVCSGPCDEGCTGLLPRCVDVAGLGSICARTPPTTTSGATGKLSGKTWAFDHAYFGYDFGDAGPVATSLEIQAGSDGSCPPPKKDPQATIVLAGLPGKLAAQEYTGIKATLLGFDASLPVKSSATAVKLSLGALEGCAVSGTCAFDADVSLVFAEGSVTGKVHAIHCDSMDVK